VRTIRYTADAAKALRKHGNVADRIRKAVRDYAENPASHRNNVTALRGTTGYRLRVGDYRVVFEEAEGELIVTKIGPRGSVYRLRGIGNDRHDHRG
jgi:mRNA interferase RelE/StbE